jgi:beta-1,4-mannosyltransferase
MQERNEVLRVLMYPGTAISDGSPYIPAVVQALKRQGVEVTDWNQHLSFQSGDIFHVHWPEHIAITHRRKNHSLRGKLMAWNFFRTIKRVRAAGGRIVWTAHNLNPHESYMTGDEFLKRLMKRFIAEVDVCFSFTAAAIPLILERYPELSSATMVVARHPHLRSIFSRHPEPARLRKALGIRPDQFVFAILGALRSNKGVESLVEKFVELAPEQYFLLLAGSAKAELKDGVESMLSSNTNYLFRPERIPGSELEDLHAVTNALVIPGTNYLNSGTIYTALSMDVPVLVADSPVNRELQRLVGGNWIQVFSGDLTADVLREASSALSSPPGSATLDLSAFDPDVCATKHLLGYRGALER